MHRLSDKLGICQWFHYEDYEGVEQCVDLLHQAGVKHLRTGVSWADWHRPRGREWYQWQMRQLADFEVLLSIWHTPPSIAEGGICAGPPLRLEDYAGFVGQTIDLYGDYFTHLELWNEPNNRLKWAFPDYDPMWEKFGRMIGFAAQVAAEKGVPTVLGGMIPVDHHWLQLMESYGALQYVDVIAIHAFPGMWWNNQPNWDWYRDWQGWENKIDYISQYTDKPIWVTETGLATWDFDTEQEGRFGFQSSLLVEAADAPVDRLYWYSMIDLAPDREAIEGFHVDENEYHMGLTDWRFRPKPAFETLRKLLAPGREKRFRAPTLSPLVPGLQGGQGRA